MCNYGTKLIGNLSIHMDNHIGTYFSCNICVFTSKLRIEYRSHFIGTHMMGSRGKGWMHQNTVYHCSMCDMQAIGNDFEVHMVKVHKLPVGERKGFLHKKKISNGVITLENAFQCNECIFKTNLASNMRLHMHKHIGSEYSCTLCETKSETTPETN